MNKLSRRDFLRLSGVFGLTALLPWKQQVAPSESVIQKPVMQECANTLTDGGLGGYLVPPEFRDEIIRDLNSPSPAIRGKGVKITWPDLAITWPAGG